MPITTDARNIGVDAIADAISSVSLHTASPGTTGANELSGNGYSRATTTGGDWGESNGAATNNADIRFVLPTDDWGSVTHFGLWGSVGFLGYGTFSSAITVERGDTVEFLVGALSVTIPA